MTKDEALKRALEALESCGWNCGYKGENQYFNDELVDKAITAIKEALAQPTKLEPNDSFERDEAARATVREFMRNH